MCLERVEYPYDYAMDTHTVKHLNYARQLWKMSFISKVR